MKIFYVAGAILRGPGRSDARAILTRATKTIRRVCIDHHPLLERAATVVTARKTGLNECKGLPDVTRFGGVKMARKGKHVPYMSYHTDIALRKCTYVLHMGNAIRHTHNAFCCLDASVSFPALMCRVRAGMGFAMVLQQHPHFNI